MVKKGSRYWVVYTQETNTVEIFTSRTDASKSVGLNAITLWRYEKKASLYNGEDFLVLFANGITKNQSRVLKGKALSGKRFK